MPNAFASFAAVSCLAVAGTTACASTQDTIQQQREKITSLASSTELVASDWLAGQLSQRYTSTALEALFQQVEQQRSTLASKPQALSDPSGGALSQEAEQLARALAELQRDVERGNGASVRDRLSRLPLVPGGP